MPPAPQEVAIDHVTSLGIEPGATIRVSGVVRTSFDGSAFDAVSTWNAASSGVDGHPGGLFDLVAGGLRIVDSRPAEHTYVLSAADAPGAACVAAGVDSPCLVPRLAEIAHARLRSTREIAGTLSGGLVVEPRPPPAPPVGREVWATAGVTVAVVAIGAAAVVARRRARTPLGRVHASARRALRVIRADPTFDGVREKVAALVARATELDAARRACLRRIGALGPARDDVVRAEVARIEGEGATCADGIARIETALRVVASRAVGAAPASEPDPVDVVGAELSLRAEALDEADRAAPRR